MATKIKDVIHLYIGQALQSYWGDRKETYIIKGVIYPHVILDYDVEDEEITSRLDISFKQKKGREAKLLLRPWSSVTEKDIEPFNKVVTPINEGTIGQAQATHWAKRINFLRSIGVDCDGLIDSGQAIGVTL